MLPAIDSPRPAAVSSTKESMREWRHAVDEEAGARKRIAKLKRELHRKKLLQSEAAARQRREHEAAALRDRLAEARGAKTSEAAASLEAASEESVMELSERFNAQLLLSTERGSSGEATVRVTWYALFKDVDTNDSGKITYDEFLSAIRRKDCLNLSADALSDEQALALWKALDEDGNGHISHGEWGHFMKRGQPAAAESARQRLIAMRAAAKRKADAEADVHAGRHVTALLAAEPAASEAELKEYSGLLNAALRRITADGEQGEQLVWFRLFKAVDYNGSGLIDYFEYVTEPTHSLTSCKRIAHAGCMLVDCFEVVTKQDGAHSAPSAFSARSTSESCRTGACHQVRDDCARAAAPRARAAERRGPAAAVEGARREWQRHDLGGRVGPLHAPRRADAGHAAARAHAGEARRGRRQGAAREHPAV